MAGFEHLLASFDVRDELDEIASADPPAYLRRCFAEGMSAPELDRRRAQQLGVCAMVLDAMVNGRDYDVLEPELIGDWRAHYAAACSSMRDTATAALRRAAERLQGADADSAADLAELARRLSPG